MDIPGRTIVVAGAAGHLGSAVAAALTDRGANVAGLDLRASGEGSQDTSTVRADAADETSAVAAVDEIEKRFGTIDALVNCSGLIHSEPLVNLTNPQRRRHGIQTWDAVIRANLTAAFVLGSVVAERMAAARTKGAIVQFSSIAASGNPGQTAYSAAKAGIEALTRVWARELGPLGIRVVAIAPGFVDTPSTRGAVNEAALGELKRKTPLRRLAAPAEVASAVLFALESDFLTGCTLHVDGGLVL
ncbi:MAG: SDR family oxidoreductase [Candidatus Eremiobacteraeota bacterium]|nr:SDR family oxidoreductase [Candidatus Eremiobacteraeota bacterium]